METNNEEWQEVKSDSGLWLPTQKGEELEGEVIEINQAQYGIQLVVLKSEGIKATTPSHKALQARLVHFKIGESIKIVYLGTELPKVKGQSGTRLYAVFHKPQAEIEQVFE